MKLFADIQKVDEEQRIVAGWASTDSLDSQGEIITRAAIEGALSDYMKWANLREMHSASAVGVVKSASMDDKGLWIEAHVPDDSAWKKVVSKVYKGFSVGGSVLARDDVNKNTITAMRLVEISLVDRPANPEATIQLFKADTLENELPENQTNSLAKTDNPTADKPVGQPAAGAPEQAAGSDSASAKVEKGMWNVSQLAEILAQIECLQESSEFEEEIEGDNSKMPDALMEWLKTGGKLLGTMVAEETAEQAEGTDVDVFMMADNPTGDAVGKGLFDLEEGMDAFETLAGAASLAKSEKGKELAKGFADLGAACQQAVAKADAAAARLEELTKSAEAHAESISKAEAKLKELDETMVAKRTEVDDLDIALAAALDTLRKQVASISEIEKRVEAAGKQAVPSKTLRVLARGEDAALAEPAARKSADATALDAIKKAHQQPKYLDGRDLMRLNNGG